MRLLMVVVANLVHALAAIAALPIPTTQPGGVIVLDPGNYEPCRIDTPGITIRSNVPGAAWIHGSRTHGIYIGPRAVGVTIDGLQVTGSWYAGIKTDAERTTITRCVLLSNGQGIEAHGVAGLVVSGCRIAWNGRDPVSDHGIYADGLRPSIRANVIEHNAAFGIHLYPAAVNASVTMNRVVADRCSAILLQGSGTITNNFTTGGVYSIDPRGAGPFSIYRNSTDRPMCTDWLRGPVSTQEAR